MKKISTKALVQIAMLIAIEIVLTRFFSIQTPILRISFGFLPMAIIAMLHGPLLAGISYAVADLIGVTLFPAAAFFPGFTLSAFLTGVIFGIFLYEKPQNLIRVIISVVVIAIFIRIGLTTLWVQMITGRGFIALLPARVTAALVMIPIQIICIRAVASERFYAIFGGKAAPPNPAG